jgi:uncharacterized membrane protein (Fun14 family)
MSEIFPSLGYQLGIGGIGGFIVGYAAKKISKLIVIVLGLFIVALLYLGVRGIISINYDALWNALANSLGMAESAFSWIVGVISLLPFAGSFIVGFLLGFKLG